MCSTSFHFPLGSSNCPAQSNSVLVGGPIDFLTHVKAAREKPPCSNEPLSYLFTPIDFLDYFSSDVEAKVYV